ncbi:uncharacterized protein LOC105694768 [Orussus abietinus]|uniref:uncharacterized protein LOC105694768 n=1 Tax=Orussus abietinus TaxID=222816 RepID=UPI000C716145|nr:uncharacterized protein LOC105694768 [Orussus abietinus]
MEAILRQQQEAIAYFSRIPENLRKLATSRRTPSYLEPRLGSLEEQWQAFTRRHYELVALRDPRADPPAYVTEGHFETAQDLYCDAKGAITDMIKALTPRREDHVAGGSQEGSVTAPTPTPSMASASLRLARIDVPHFSGDYLKWVHFRDMFTSLVREHTGLSEVQKLHHLMVSLEGEAKELLVNLEITAANYETAWDRLVARYENKKALVAANLYTITSLKRMASDTPAELKRISNTFTSAVDALANLGQPVIHWDAMLVHQMEQRLDEAAMADWADSHSSNTEVPTFKAMQGFLEARIRARESVTRGRDAGNKPRTGGPITGIRKGRDPPGVRAHAAVAKDTKCLLCSGVHALFTCPSFKDLSVGQRRDTVARNRLCYNCLSARHPVRACQSQVRCRTCNGVHHTLLHEGRGSALRTDNQPAVQDTTEESGTEQTVASASQVTRGAVKGNTVRARPVLLATAIVTVETASGRQMRVKALIDQGSEVSLISESVAQHLQLPRKATCISIVGVGGSEGCAVKGSTNLRVRSQVDPGFTLELRALVLPRLTAHLPTQQVATGNWPHLTGLALADPDYAARSKIDLLLGADVYGDILLEGLRKGCAGAPLAQQTAVGWVLSGPTGGTTYETTGPTTAQSFQCTSQKGLYKALQRFWELEEAPTRQYSLTAEETACEDHYARTVRRDGDGRYVVRLPFKTSPTTDLCTSRYGAMRMYERNERRFITDPGMAESYRQFMEEYIRLGHMGPTAGGIRGYYLPHHAVIKDSSTTTKLRVVFNASHAALNGKSLNDLLHAGPKLQAELSDVLLRWRRHPVVFSADIEKMFRQIWTHPDDCEFQRVLWRAEGATQVATYRLRTVTYGTACAPYLAIRTLRQLAQDEEAQYPLGSAIVREDFYMDDVLSGADTVEGAVDRRQQLQGFMASGGFTLRKWTSNQTAVLAGVPPELRETGVELQLQEDTTLRMLGLRWQPANDHFRFQVHPQPSCGRWTKRAVLSDIARLFDPLGWLAPVVVTAKVILQRLWLTGTGWDEPIPPAESTAWEAFRGQLVDIEAISIPRWIGATSVELTTQCELHGFSDASERAYAAAVYLRVTKGGGAAQVTLLTAKTKVAPVKRVSLPRLELCGAALLARLVRHLRGTLRLESVPIHLWTDSTIVLAWLRGHASQWKTFVSNRVGEIQTALPGSEWHHVPGEENPADCATRGLTPRELREHHLWWSGPTWLTGDPTLWPGANVTVEPTDLEARPAPVGVNLGQVPATDLLARFSTLHRLLRVTAWCHRFGTNCRRSADDRAKGPLTPEELAQIRRHWVRIAQLQGFPDEIGRLQGKKGVSLKSAILKFGPFLDDQGMLRVGGRLQHSLLAYDEKHPILLPGKHRFATLVIGQAHRAVLHGGTQMTLGYLRWTFWIVGWRTRVRQYIHRCIACLRQRAALTTPLMGSLPPARVRPARPFLHTGVDYAGPVQLRTSKGRGQRTYKGYIALFVCLATRAVHLEVVSDYSSEGFLAAYRRFTARRGICDTLYSDQGTNFIGADRELAAMFKASAKERQDIVATLANDGARWRFNPPAAPHFGGLWEAGVKSVKHHLRRVIGEATLTYEEFATFLTQVEACLNSRPLRELTDDPEDLTALTPGHLLIGAPLTTVPEPSLLEVSMNRLSRWQLLRRMYEHFWDRWSREYLRDLHTRSKWKTRSTPVRVGDMALLKDERLPPTKWPLVRIVETHPGPDGEVRVVTDNKAKDNKTKDTKAKDTETKDTKAKD